MKILQVKLSNPIAYLLLLFTGASVLLFLYGQFSNLEFETLNNTSQNIPPVTTTNIQVAEPVVEESAELPTNDAPQTGGDMTFPYQQ